MRISPKNYSTLLAILVVIEAFLIFLDASPWIKIPFFFLYFFATGAAIGKLFGQTSQLAIRIFYGVCLVVSSWIILGTAIYYLWQFQTAVLAAFFVLTGAVSIFIEKKQTEDLSFSFSRPKIRDILFSCLFAAEFAAAATLLFRHATGNAIRSPWEMIPATFFLLLSLLVFTLFSWQRKSKNFLQTVFAGGLVLLCLLVAAIIYKIGYGFDPFIHEAAIKEILAHGFVLPKSPFYIGAYVLILSMTKLTGLSLHFINVVTGPILGTLALTGTAVSIAASAPVIAILLTILAPLSHFISTTPQGIADAFALLAVIATFQTKKDRRFWIVSLLAAIAALCIHPLAGIPALLVVATLFVSRQKPRLSISFALAACLLALFVFPTTVFFAQPTLDVSLAFHGARTRLATIIVSYFAAPTIHSFSSLRTLLYAARTIFPFVFLLIALLNLRKKDERRTKIFLVLTAAILTLGGIVLGTFVQFQNVIGYEATIFPLRFITLATLFLFPLFLEDATDFLSNISKKPRGVSISCVLLVFVVVSGTYLAYPRIDPEDESGGRNVSTATVEAVNYLHTQDMTSAVVLGNQTLAAAWISQYGFSKYVNGEFFFSEPAASLHLYNYYLDAVTNEPTRELINKVMDEYHVETVYLVLHNYWKNFTSLSSEAKASADNTVTINNGDVIIFTYTKHNP